MKRVEITVPEQESDDVEAVLEDYTENLVSTTVEKAEKSFVRFDVTMDSEDIDALTADLKGMTALESGDLTIDVLEVATVIEKGKRKEGGSSALSVEEMYTKAFEFASFSRASWALIGLAAGIAVFGTAMENVMVVIGAMMLAPVIGPFIALSFGLVIGDRKLIQDSATYASLSMVFAVGVSFVLASIIEVPMRLQVNSLIAVIADPGFGTVPLSLLVGAAAALTFTTEARELLAGVAVAIALVPPAAVAGMTLAMNRPDLFFEVSLVLLSHMAALILAGSVTFKLSGIAPSTYYRQKVSEENLRTALMISIGSLLLIGGVVGYLSFQDLQRERAVAAADEVVSQEIDGDILAQDIDASGDQLQVTVTAVNPGTTGESLETVLHGRIGRPVAVRLIAVDGEVS